MINKNMKKSIIPAILLGITVAFLSFLLDITEHELIISSSSKLLIFASFGSSAFIMYMMPESDSAHVDKFVKSYLAAGIIGFISTLIVPYIGLFYSIAVAETFIAIVLIVIKAKHPPAAAIGIVFLLSSVGLYGIIIIIVGIVTISVMTKVLMKTVSKAEVEIKKIEEK